MGIKKFAGLVWRDGRRKKRWTDLGSNMYFERFRFVLRYDIIVLLSNRDPATGGGEHMEIVISFLVAVAAGMTCHLICKWLDSHNKDNE